MDIVSTLMDYWVESIFVFFAFVTFIVYLGYESTNRSHRRFKRNLKKYSLMIFGVAMAFVVSIMVGMLAGAVGSLDVKDSSTSPLHLVLGFLVVIASAVLVGVMVSACVKLGRSRSVAAY